MYIKKVLFLIATVALLSSCRTNEKISYFPNADVLTKSDLASNEVIYEAKVFPKDVLIISVNTVTPEVAAPFNLGSTAGSGVITTGSTIQGAELQTYVVDKDGYINYPMVGKIKLLGLTRNQAQELIKNSIYPAYITEEPIINVRFKNYKISVLGEVTRPGTYTLTNEQCTLFDALAQAGDLTIYGNRQNVMLIREDEKGAKSIFRLDLQDNNILRDPSLYYMQQNDVVYVEPNKAKKRQSRIGGADTFIISTVNILVSISNLIVAILR